MSPSVSWFGFMISSLWFFILKSFTFSTWKKSMALLKILKVKWKYLFHFMCVYECMYVRMQQCKEPIESVGLIVLSLISVPLPASHLWQGLYSQSSQEIILLWWSGDQESFVSHPTHTLCQLSYISLGAGISVEIDISGVTGRCELLHVGWEWNPDNLQENWRLLTPEP